MKNNRKIIIVLSLLIVSIALLTSCKNKEMGKVKKVETDSSKASTELNLYKKTSSPYSYKYTKVKNGRINLTMDIPSTWDVSDKNTSVDMEFTTPSNDPFLPKTTLHLVSDLNTIAYPKNSKLAEGDFDSTELTDAQYYNSFFKHMLTRLDYNSNDGVLNLAYWKAPQESITNFAFTGEDNCAASMQVHKNATLQQRTKDVVDNGYDMVCMYFRWYQYRGCLSCVVENEYTDNAKAMLKYLISSITYSEDAFNYNTVKVANFSFKLPDEFLLVENSSIYVCPAKSMKNSTSGMAVSLYKNDLKKGTKLDKKTFTAQYVSVIARKMMYTSLPYSVTGGDVIEEGTVTIGGKSFNHYVSSVQFISYDDAAPLEIYGAASDYNMDFYVNTENNKQTVLSIMYSPQQAKAANIVTNKIIKTAKIK